MGEIELFTKLPTVFKRSMSNNKSDLAQRNRRKITICDSRCIRLELILFRTKDYFKQFFFCRFLGVDFLLETVFFCCKMKETL